MAKIVPLEIWCHKVLISLKLVFLFPCLVAVLLRGDDFCHNCVAFALLLYNIRFSDTVVGHMTSVSEFLLLFVLIFCSVLPPFDHFCKRIKH